MASTARAKALGKRRAEDVQDPGSEAAAFAAPGEIHSAHFTTTSQKSVILHHDHETIRPVMPAVLSEARLPNNSDAAPGPSACRLLRDPAEAISDEQEQSDTSALYGPLPLPSVEELKITMLEQNYCPHQIEYLAQAYDNLALYRFAQIDRRISRPEDHRRCVGESRCIAFNTTLGDGYQIRHAEWCSQEHCYMVETPQDDLLNVVRAGGVPLVSIHEADDGRLSIKVARRGFKTKYATISHVWADGLGNPTQNALPACQIEYLMSFLDELAEDEDQLYSEPASTSAGFDDVFLQRKIRIWMDTLCIPVGSEHQTLRDQCIDAMASIYAGSYTVLVLDRELMQTALDRSQASYQIACSVWMCRSWTLQEARLPPSCVFQFSDELYLAKKESPDNSGAPFHDLIGLRKRGFVDLIQKGRLREAKGIDTDIFVFVWNELAGRGSTKVDDLWVVLASCLDFKLRQFRCFRSMDEKMQRIIFSFETLPFSLFYNAGPRLHSSADHQNRWIPTRISRDLLSKRGSTFRLPGSNISKYSDQGTQLELDLHDDVIALLVDRAIPKLQEYTFAQDEHEYQIRAFLDPSDQLQTKNCVATCIILDSHILTTQGTVRGAWFYISTLSSSIEAGTTKTRLEMIYFGPVLASTRDQSKQPERTKEERFPAQLLDRNCKFLVKFKPIPGFKPLNRQNLFDYDAITVSSLGILGTLALGGRFVVWAIDGRHFPGFVYNFFEGKYATNGILSSNPLNVLMLLLVLCYVLAAFLVTYCVSFLSGLAISYGLSCLQDYIFLYQSYDDNTVMNKLGRLIGVVAMTSLHTLRSTWKKLWKEVSKKSDPRAAIHVRESEF